MTDFVVKDSGARQEFAGGMVRDTTEGKVNFLNVRFGPMLRRWAEHLTKGRVKYPDVAPGTPNWTLAAGVEEYLRAKESAARHFESWLAGERDEDHAAGVYFNVNLAEYVLERMEAQGDHVDPGMGAAPVGNSLGHPSPEPDRSFTFYSVYEDGAEVAEPCNDRGPDAWFCERPKGHVGLHWFPKEQYTTMSETAGTWG